MYIASNCQLIHIHNMAATPTALKYELLCVDTKGATGFSKEEKLIMNLLSREELYPEGSYKKTGGIHSLVDSSVGLVTVVGLFDTKQESLISNGQTFLITVSGTKECLAPFRHKFLTYLQRLKFEDVYILTDDVSAEIACEIYPSINRIENYLRKFLLKFFVTKYGEKWWSITADPNMESKVRNRQDNETVFKNLVRNHVYSIDFGDLGKIIYASSSGYNEKESIVKELMQIKSLEDVHKLQHEVQNNQIKFFQKTFTDKGFKNYWQSLERIRNKVAHNNLFVTEDLDSANKLIESLNQILADADNEIDSLVLDIVLPASLMPTDDSSAQRKIIINDEIFIQKLTKVEEDFNQRNWDIGLKRFVTTMLDLEEEDFVAGYNVAKSLKEKGIIDFEQKEGKNGTLRTFIFTTASRARKK